MYPLIMFTSFVGAYSVSNNMFSVWVVFVAGLVGYAMKRLDFPVAPLVMGLVLGPLLEKALVQTSAIGDGNLSIIFTRPLSAAVLVLAVLLLAGPVVVSKVLRRRAASTSNRHDPISRR